MNNILIEKRLIVLLLSLLLFSCKFDDAKDNNVENNSNDKSVLKQQEVENNDSSSFNFLPTSTTNEIVKHDYYTLSYNEKYEQAEWVAYELKQKPGGYHDYKRPFFIEDKEVNTKSADWRNYKNSGYDKGHLCPAGDMKFSQEAYDDTFFTSNISPQNHEFNDGIWNTLEGKVRYWSVKYNGLYVVTGGVLTNDLKRIGKEDVAVPRYFYKVLLNHSEGKYKMIGFLVPAEDSSKPLYNFVVSVDSIEKMTGIDFFPALNDSIENELEKSSDYKSWSFK